MTRRLVVSFIFIVFLIAAGTLWRASQVIEYLFLNEDVQNQETLGNTDLEQPKHQELDLPKPNYIAPAITYENYQSKYGPLPRSLRGTAIPASFTLNEQGHLVITRS
ncbi:MAG: hypothetical protein KUG73_04625, partial [Pseudomonadales bacterium]|nr:hypothetical protein [Pseudomonadales bacterium]